MSVWKKTSCTGWFTRSQVVCGPWSLPQLRRFGCLSEESELLVYAIQNKGIRSTRNIPQGTLSHSYMYIGHVTWVVTEAYCFWLFRSSQYWVLAQIQPSSQSITSRASFNERTSVIDKHVFTRVNTEKWKIRNHRQDKPGD